MTDSNVNEKFPLLDRYKLCILMDCCSSKHKVSESNLSITKLVDAILTIVVEVVLGKKTFSFFPITKYPQKSYNVFLIEVFFCLI